jgi:hypothetical protein
MRTSSTKNSLIIGISIVLGASLLSVGVSNAAGESIKACAKKSGGAMRLIDSNKNCKKSERTLTWGTQGDAGATGTTGLNGTNGSNGTIGSTGTNGSPGASGLSKVHHYQLDSSSLLTFTNETLRRGITMAALPAGDYALDFSTMVMYESGTSHTGAAYLNCLLSSEASYTAAEANRSSIYWPKNPNSAGWVLPYQIQFQPSNAAFGQTQNMAASSVVTVPGGQTLSLVCQMDEGKRLIENSDEVMRMWFISMIFTAVNEDVAIGNG